MNQPRDLDAIIATWLDDGPIDLPDATRRAISVGLRTQPRVPRMAILGGSSTSPINHITAAAAIVLAVGGLSVFVLANRGGASATPPPSASTATPSSSPSPSPPPSIAPSPSISTADWVPFSSTINGFSARFPSDWTVTLATKVGDLASISGADRAVFDDAVSPAGRPDISGVSTKLPGGMTADQWLAAYRQPIIDQSAESCFPTRDMWEAVTVDGETDGGLYDGCEWHYLPNETPNQSTRNYVESMLFVDDRVYIFQLNLGVGVVQTGETRPLLRAFLTTVTFDVASARNP